MASNRLVKVKLGKSGLEAAWHNLGNQRRQFVLTEGLRQAAQDEPLIFARRQFREAAGDDDLDMRIMLLDPLCQFRACHARHRMVGQHDVDPMIRVQHLEGLLSDETKLMATIIDELKQIRADFADERRTLIVDTEGEILTESLIDPLAHRSRARIPEAQKVSRLIVH